MALALREAREALRRGDVPVGAVVVRDGTVLGRGSNRKTCDPTAHAEVGIAMVVIALLIGMATVFAFGRLTPALASSWGLIWVCVARWAGHRTLALAALAAAVVPVVGAIWWKLRDPRPA